MPLVSNQLVRLSHTVGCCGPQCGVVSAGVISIASGRLEGFEGCAVPTYHHFVRVDQACSQRAFAQSFDDHSSTGSNIVAFTFHVGDNMILAA
eukprot:1153940-Pelagomonas_calceolata.AAC.1